MVASPRGGVLQLSCQVEEVQERVTHCIASGRGNAGLTCSQTLKETSDARKEEQLEAVLEPVVVTTHNGGEILPLWSQI